MLLMLVTTGIYKNILAASTLPQNDSFKMVNLPHENPEKFYAKNRSKLSLKLPISQCFTFITF